MPGKLSISVIFILVMMEYPAMAGNFESWLNLSWSQRLDYGLEAKIENEQWFSAESPHYKHVEVLPQLVWRYSPRYDFAIGYEYSWTQSDNDMITEGNSGFIDTTIKLPLQRFNLSSRQRFQFGTESSEMGDSQFIALYRPKTILQYDMPWLPVPLMPFLADEVIFDMYNGRLMENRVQVGVAYRFNSSYMIELYGMRVDQWNVTGQHSSYPVAGVNLSMQF